MVHPSQTPKWDPTSVLSSVFLGGDLQLKFCNYRNPSLRLLLVNGHDPCLLLVLHESPHISDTFLTSNNMPMGFYSNVTLSFWGSFTPTIKIKCTDRFSAPVTEETQTSILCFYNKEKEGFLEYLCHHNLLFHHPWEGSLRTHSHTHFCMRIHTETQPVIQLYYCW